MKIGIIGVWHVHTDDYVRQVRESGLAEIAAVWDEEPEVGKSWAAHNNVEFVPTLDALLAREDIAAVICNAPTTRHADVLTKAAAAGKHIFTEKLLAHTEADALAIIHAVEEANVICTVSMPLLASGWVLHVKGLLEAGALGRVTGARMRRSHSGVSDNWLPERWFDTSRSGGGALMDLGAHPVYVLSHLLGKPSRVTALMTNPYGTSSDENAIALVEFEGGVLATCETGFLTFGVPDILEIYGTEGAVFVRGGEVSVASKGMRQVGVGETKVTHLRKGGPSPIIAFVNACLTGGPVPEGLGPRDALDMTRIIASAYRANEEGNTVTL